MIILLAMVFCLSALAYFTETSEHSKLKTECKTSLINSLETQKKLIRVKKQLIITLENTETKIEGFKSQALPLLREELVEMEAELLRNTTLLDKFIK